MRLMLLALSIFIFVMLSVLPAYSDAQTGVPGTMTYQGRLTQASGAPVPDSIYNIRFIIYDAPTFGNVLWNSGFQPLQTRGGIFSYVFGSNVAFPEGLFESDTNRYLGISIDVDPEMTPRVKFSTQPYVYRALKSTAAESADIASNAENLGGSPPSFYLDWNNFSSLPPGFADGVDDTTSNIEWTAVTNIPADFADGVDDTATSLDWTALTSVPSGFADGVDNGISQDEADNSFLNVTGDTLSGDLVWTGEVGDTAILINRFGRMIKTFGQDGLEQVRLWGIGWGELLLHDGSVDNDITVVLSASNDGGGALTLTDKMGIPTLRLLGGLTGDNSVLLPNDAISSDEIFDEPGLVQARNLSSSGIILSTFGMQDLVTVTVTTPASGYILLRGRASCAMDGSDSTNIVRMQIDETVGGTVQPAMATMIGFEGIDSSGVHFYNCSIERTYFKSAGTYLFRLEGMQTPESSGSAVMNFPVLTAMYFPSAYGAVSTVTSDPGDHPDAKAVTLIGLDGGTLTAYEMDLRYFEEKARAARIAKQKAELEALRAQMELDQARQGVKQD